MRHHRRSVMPTASAAGTHRGRLGTAGAWYVSTASAMKTPNASVMSTGCLRSTKVRGVVRRVVGFGVLCVEL